MFEQVQESTIQELFQNYGENIKVTKDKRYFAELPNMELQYYDEETGTIKWGEVQFIQRHHVDKRIFKIELENGDFVQVTQDHSLMVLRNNRLIECKTIDIRENDLFITFYGNYKCVNIQMLDRGARWVYDIQMKDNPHTFFANGVLVHNSIFLKVKTEPEKLNEWLNNFNNNQLMNLIKESNPHINPDYFQYNLQHEKDLDYLYLGDRKKRYYAIERNGNKYIHGLNIIRKDTPKLIKTMLDQLCQKAVKQDISIEDLKLTFQQLKQANYQDVAVHKSFSKKFEQYEKTMPQHVAGALYANKHLDLKIIHSDVVFLFYINSFCQPQIKLKDRKNVICLRTQDFDLIKETDKFQIDYMQLFEKQILLPLRQFDKIQLVSNAINEWCKVYPQNYRIDKHGTYIFKKKDVTKQ